MREPDYERPVGDGVQKIYRFANGYGAIVARNQYTYGGASGLWEVTLIYFRSDNILDFEVDFDVNLSKCNKITETTMGYLTEGKVDIILDEIEKRESRLNKGDNKMEIFILNESGYHEALFGLGLSYGITSTENPISIFNNNVLMDKLKNVSLKLYNKDGGHNKFLESIQIWLDVTAPRYFWSEADTYRIGSTKQSDSTMHTLLKTPFTQNMFAYDVPSSILEYLETLRQEKEFKRLKALLPEGFLQRRIWNINYKTLRNIITQRQNHRLDEWKKFCEYMYESVQYPEYIRDLKQMREQ